MIEHPASNGCSSVYACGPLHRQRYINPKLEKELVDFKKEVEGKFAKSETAAFSFPRSQDATHSSLAREDDLTHFLVEASVGLRRRVIIPKTDRKLAAHSKKQFLTQNQRTSKNETSVNLSINYETQEATLSQSNQLKMVRQQ